MIPKFEEGFNTRVGVRWFIGAVRLPDNAFKFQYPFGCEVVQEMRETSKKQTKFQYTFGCEVVQEMSNEYTDN